MVYQRLENLESILPMTIDSHVTLHTIDIGQGLGFVVGFVSGFLVASSSRSPLPVPSPSLWFQQVWQEAGLTNVSLPLVFSGGTPGSHCG